MKQLFIVFSFILAASLSSNAQTCTKSASAGKACCASKKMASASSSVSDTKVASAIMEVDEAIVASNGNVVKRTCEMSGTTSYFEKSVSSDSDKISWEEVKYDTDTKSFTKVASASMEKDANGAKVVTKACCAKKDGKACCAKKDGAKACVKSEGTN
ncbi:MAG: hypothetical protein H7X99_02085 [Saprospiraceae bacterium]|nr:hypothetical protein [Saprospiraceae bacterium]